MLQSIPSDLTDADFIAEFARGMQHSPEVSKRLRAISSKLLALEDFFERIKPRPAPRVRTARPTGVTIGNISKQDL